MTVLEEEKNVDEQLAPPRKKPCLSLSGRNRIIKSFTEVQQTELKSKNSTTNKDLSYDKMLNECRNQQGNYQDLNCITDDANDSLRVASLCNLGNTCFLNSVLYTLRFAPSFLHNLHHLATDLKTLNEKQCQTKIKSSSLGRTGVPLTTSGSRSLSSKDLLTFAGSASEINKSKIQYATEKLHELFIALRIAEVKDNSLIVDGYQPDAFLQALREVNPIFEGNQQQDAHELLVCLLDNIRETFQLLVKHRETQFGQRNKNSDISVENVADTQSESGNTSKRNTRKSLKKKKSKNASDNSNQMTFTSRNGMTTLSKPLENGHADFQKINRGIPIPKPESKKCFISEDFEGDTLLRTTCIECENVTERKERFSDICVPIETDQFIGDDSDMYRKAVVTSELLSGTEKYWCSNCLRKNEARRAVSFPVLPRLLILQLKRFSTTAGSTEKIIRHMPTPPVLQCFCDECCNESQRSTSGNRESRHTYNLYSVIMHQGVTMTAGHYVAYTKLPDASAYNEYLHCTRNKHQQNHQAESSTTDKISRLTKLSKFLRGKPSVNEAKEQQSSRAGCWGLECCGAWQEKHAGSWLECDDEAVRIISWQELQDKLEPNHRNTATPYLLFYVRSSA